MTQKPVAVYGVISSNAMLSNEDGIIPWGVLDKHKEWGNFERIFSPRAQVKREGATASRTMTNDLKLNDNKYMFIGAPPNMPSDTVMTGAVEIDENGIMDVHIGFYSPERLKELGKTIDVQHADEGERHAVFIIIDRQIPFI